MNIKTGSLAILISFCTIPVSGMEQENSAKNKKQIIAQKRTQAHSAIAKEQDFFNLSSIYNIHDSVENYRINNYIKTLTTEQKNTHRETLEKASELLNACYSPRQTWDHDDLELCHFAEILTEKLK